MILQYMGDIIHLYWYNLFSPSNKTFCANISVRRVLYYLIFHTKRPAYGTLPLKKQQKQQQQTNKFLPNVKMKILV